MASKKEERVELFLPKGYANEEKYFFIGINGINYLLPRGQRSLVPKAVAEEYDRSVRAEESLDRDVAAMTAEG